MAVRLPLLISAQPAGRWVLPTPPPHLPPRTGTLPVDAPSSGPGGKPGAPARVVSVLFLHPPALTHVLGCRLVQIMSKSLKKLVEESREKNQPEVDMSDRGISNMLDVNGLCEFLAGPSPWRSCKGLKVLQVTASRCVRGCHG